jgi:outer membrane murein-binding lipoprotein Lpp
MHQSIKIIAGAVVCGFSLIAAGFAAAPSGPDTLSIMAQDLPAPTAAQRIEVAIESATRAEASPAIMAAAKSAQKGDLLVRPGCAGQYWPYIAPDCLVVGDSRPNPPGRTVTVGYNVSDTSSVLIRMPVPQIASR